MAIASESAGNLYVMESVVLEVPCVHLRSNGSRQSCFIGSGEHVGGLKIPQKTQLCRRSNAVPGTQLFHTRAIAIIITMAQHVVSMMT